MEALKTSVAGQSERLLFCQRSPVGMLAVGTTFLKHRMAGWILGPTAGTCHAKQNFAPRSLMTQSSKPHLYREQSSNSFKPNPLRDLA